MKPTEKLIIENFDIWTSAIKSKSHLGRLSNTNLELYGIGKLRQFILDLAVRGILIPQDPLDGKASDLLKRITEEKSKLAFKNNLKLDKKISNISENEAAILLPKQWEWCLLGDISIMIRGITFPASEKSKIPEDGRLICLRTSNIQEEIEWDDLLYIREQYVKREDQIIAKNDIVMSMANSRELVGKVAIVKKEPKYRSTFGGFLGVIRPILVNPRYLTIALRSSIIRSKLIDNASQTTNIANISLSKLNSLVLPLPPISEQNRIVEKVHELMRICNQLEKEQERNLKTHETLVSNILGIFISNSEEVSHLSKTWKHIQENFDTLFTTEKSVDQLEQTILKLALMGKLVPQDPVDEPAEVLFRKITEKKESLIEKGLLKKQKSLPPISAKEKPFQIPANWKWVRLNDAFDIRDGTHDSPQDASGDDTFPLITSKDFKKGNINFKEARRISRKDHLKISERSYVEVNDILFSMIGGNLGNQVMVEDPRPFSIKNLALFKYYSQELTQPKFLKIYTEELALGLQHKASGGAQPFISLGALRNLPLALPPIAEQHRIASKVDELIKLCQKLKKSINSAHSTKINLTDNLIEKLTDKKLQTQ